MNEIKIVCRVCEKTIYLPLRYAGQIENIQNYSLMVFDQKDKFSSRMLPDSWICKECYKKENNK